MNREQEIQTAVDHMTEVVRIAAAGLVRHNREAALALNGCAVALGRKRTELRDQILAKIDG